MSVIRRYEIGRDGHHHTVLIERSVEGERVTEVGGCYAIASTGEVILPLSTI